MCNAQLSYPIKYTVGKDTFVTYTYRQSIKISEYYFELLDFRKSYINCVDNYTTLDIVYDKEKEKNKKCNIALEECFLENDNYKIDINKISYSLYKQEKRKRFWKICTIILIAGITSNQIYYYNK